MMIGRLEDMTPADQWREDERRKGRKRDIAASFLLALVASAIIGAVLFLLAGTAHADQGFIAWLGRVEPAECHYLETDPVTEVCVSESWKCVYRGDEQTCQINR